MQANFTDEVVGSLVRPPPAHRPAACSTRCISEVHLREIREPVGVTDAEIDEAEKG